jgi:hypothetical protein
VSVEDKARYAAEPLLAERLRIANALAANPGRAEMARVPLRGTHGER